MSRTFVQLFIAVDKLTVYSRAEDIPSEPEQTGSEQQISFLKKQQWNIDFRTEPVHIISCVLQNSKEY